MTLQERVNKFLSELGVPVTVFAKKVNLSARSIYAWRRGDLILSNTSLQRIEQHITKYGF